MEYSLNSYKQNRPKSWELFFNTLFDYRKKSVHIQRKCDNVFQIIFNIVHNGQKKTLMHVSLSETVHDICCSKELIQILNRMGLCMSYNEVERLDNNLALRTIKKAGVHRVPVPPSIQPGLLIQGAMDNFDHEENTKSGIGGSHDTILMLFQNPDKDEQDEPRQLSTKPTIGFIERALDRILDCQKLVHFRKYGGRVKIPNNFTPEASLDTHNIEVSANYDFMIWVIARFATKANVPDYTCDKASIPSFTATNSLIKYEKYPLTRIAFTPIIPHPATEYDTIHTPDSYLYEKFPRCPFPERSRMWTFVV